MFVMKIENSFLKERAKELVVCCFTYRFYPWSFIRSPGWVQIKCELRCVHYNSVEYILKTFYGNNSCVNYIFSRVLASFAFSLNIDWEILDKKGVSIYTGYFA